MPFENFSIERLAGRTPPARLYLWSIDVIPPAGATDILTIYARSCTLPGLENTEIEIPYMNSRFWIAGRRNWETIDVIFMENEAGDIWKIFYEWNNKIYNVEESGQGGVPKDYKSRLDITRLTVKGEEIDNFIVQGAWPMTTSTIELAYDSDDKQELTVTFRYDFWTRNPQAAALSESARPAAGQLGQSASDAGLEAAGGLMGI